MTQKMVRIEPGTYRVGRFTIRGIATRWDGRDGSRINRWLVSDADGRLVSEHPTLARAREDAMGRGER